MEVITGSEDVQQKWTRVTDVKSGMITGSEH